MHRSAHRLAVPVPPWWRRQVFLGPVAAFPLPHAPPRSSVQCGCFSTTAWAATSLAPGAAAANAANAANATPAASAPGAHIDWTAVAAHGDVPEDVRAACALLAAGKAVRDGRLAAVVRVGAARGWAAAGGLELARAAACSTDPPSLPGKAAAAALCDVCGAGSDGDAVVREVCGMYASAGRRVPLAVVAALLQHAPALSVDGVRQLLELCVWQGWGSVDALSLRALDDKAAFPALLPTGAALAAVWNAACGTGFKDLAVSAVGTIVQGVALSHHGPAQRDAVVHAAAPLLHPDTVMEFVEALATACASTHGAPPCRIPRRLFSDAVVGAVATRQHGRVVALLETLAGAGCAPVHHVNVANAEFARAGVGPPAADLPATAGRLVPRLARLLRTAAARSSASAVLNADAALYGAVAVMLRCPSVAVAHVRDLHALHRAAFAGSRRGPAVRTLQRCVDVVHAHGGPHHAQLAVWLLGLLKDAGDGDGYSSAASVRRFQHAAVACADADAGDLLYQLLAFAPQALFTSPTGGPAAQPNDLLAGKADVLQEDAARAGDGDAGAWPDTVPTDMLVNVASRLASRQRTRRAADVVSLLRRRQDAVPAALLQELSRSEGGDTPVRRPDVDMAGAVAALRSALYDVSYVQRVREEGSVSATRSGVFAAAVGESDVPAPVPVPVELRQTLGTDAGVHQELMGLARAMLASK